MRPIDAAMDEFQERDSGWSLRFILNLSININKFNSMRGSSYMELPNFIKKRKACVNVKNNDDQCFKWAILSALHPVAQNMDRLSAYTQYADEYNFKDITFPVDPREVVKFEKQNDVSVNVYFLKKKKSEVYTVLPHHVTIQKEEEHVNLLLIESYYIDEDEEEESVNDFDDFPHSFNYLWIKDLSRLVSSQLSARKSETFLCDRCLHYFRTVEKLIINTVDCEKMN